MSGSRPSPFTIRLTASERAALEQRAAGYPLGSFIKAILFADQTRLRSRRRAVADEAALGRVLALLGRSHMANNFNQLAKAANMGALPVTPELEAELSAACADIRRMRSELLKALGTANYAPPLSMSFHEVAR